jgi:hypothetical protein
MMKHPYAPTLWSRLVALIVRQAFQSGVDKNPYEVLGLKVMRILPRISISAGERSTRKMSAVVSRLVVNSAVCSVHGLVPRTGSVST